MKAHVVHGDAREQGEDDCVETFAEEALAGDRLGRVLTEGANGERAISFGVELNFFRREPPDFPDLTARETHGHAGKALSAQVKELVPWTRLSRIVQCWHGDSGVGALSRAGRYRARAFAQLTCRPRLRDIEASRLTHVGEMSAVGLGSALGFTLSFVHIDRGPVEGRPFRAVTLC